MWLFENNFIEEIPEGYYGFVYQITNILNGKKYIGRKYFTKASTRQKNKKKKKIRKESDWKDYYGSSNELLADIETLGKENFKREILRLCKTRGETNYFESKYLFINEALESDQYYNSWISIKIHRSSVKPK